jgi:hypothetical protein
LGVPALMLIGGGLGWWLQAWLKEQYQWRLVIGADCSDIRQERALKSKDEIH